MVRTALALSSLFAFAPLFEAKADFPRLGIFRKKKEEIPAGEKDQVVKLKMLLETLKSDPDEKKRLAALEEITGYDPRTHADLIPGLLVSLKNDPSPAVRGSTAEAIGGLKPVQQTAGVALEQTNGNDPSESVRKAAQSALWQYHLNGYRSAGANPATPQTAEPPLAKAKPKVATAALLPTPVKPPVVASPVSLPKPVPTPSGVYPQTAEPPLAKPKVVPELVAPPQPGLSVPPLPVVPAVPPPTTVPSIPPPGQ